MTSQSRFYSRAGEYRFERRLTLRINQVDKAMEEQTTAKIGYKFHVSMVVPVKYSKLMTENIYIFL